MKKIPLIVVILALTFGCRPEMPRFIEYEFKIDSFDWDADPYKFPAYIQDSVLQNQGAQRAAWAYSYIGDIENLHKSWDNSARETMVLTKEQADVFDLLKQEDAIDHILLKAKDHQVVIINEAHHMPQHRVFTTRLLEGLKAQGYRHLGLETYFASEKNDSTLRADGFPSLKTGFYTKEPQFGNLVRVAHNSGYNVFGYESEGHDGGKEREMNQAKNIQDYLILHPNEKVIIHCGFDHGYEGDLSNKWEKAMAGRLTEYTGIDPLTINQTSFSERSSKEFENPYFRHAKVEKPSVFLDEHKKSFGSDRGSSWFDISVFHPRSEKYHRPSWMTYGKRKEVQFSFDHAEIECPCLVFAYKTGEDVGRAIPYDVQSTENKEVTLVLDDSDFNIVVWNSDNQAIAHKTGR